MFQLLGVTVISEIPNTYRNMTERYHMPRADRLLTDVTGVTG